VLWVGLGCAVLGWAGPSPSPTQPSPTQPLMLRTWQADASDREPQPSGRLMPRAGSCLGPPLAMPHASGP
jgi:hypothetical protein